MTDSKIAKIDDLPDDMLWSVDDDSDASLSGRISQVATRWAVVRDPVSFFQRYEVPIRQFFLRLTRDESLTEDLFQDFAVKVLRGKFQPDKPLQGRYRDYLCQSLINHVREARRRAGIERIRFHGEIAEDRAIDPADPLHQALAEFDRTEGVLIRQLVEEEMRRQQVAGKNHHLALLTYLIKLQQRKVRPDRSDPDGKILVRVPMQRVARFLTRITGQEIDEAAAAQYKHRAVREYARRLIRHISQRAESSDPRVLRRCAEKLGLHAYCGAEIERMRQASASDPAQPSRCSAN